MVEKIKSLTELAIKLATSETLLRTNSYTALVSCCLKVQATAKLKFGKYQPKIGRYAEWKELKQATVRRKSQAGGGADPLIGHYAGENNRGGGGALRKSILIRVKGMTGVVGTNDPIAPHHEFGTKHIPPRPFLRPALYQEKDFIKEELKKAIAKTLLGL